MTQKYKCENYSTLNYTNKNNIHLFVNVGRPQCNDHLIHHKREIKLLWLSLHLSLVKEMKNASETDQIYDVHVSLRKLN